MFNLLPTLSFPTFHYKQLGLNMKKILISLLLISTLFAGGDFFESKPYTRTYSNASLISFMDSVGTLALEPLMQESAEMPELIFRDRENLNSKISFSNFIKLKSALKKGSIDTSFANEIFDKASIDTSQIKEGRIAINCYSFNKFKEFAISLGQEEFSWENDLYFFKSKQIIAKHHIRHRYGLKIDHFENTNGKTVIYYKQNFMSGSGIWWYNYYFYQYDGKHMIPVLNFIETSNLQYIWGTKIMNFDTEILSTEPLTIEVDYAIDFCLPYPNENFINEKDTLRFIWDENISEFITNYSNSSLNKAKILSYYLTNNDLLFIRAYYKELKSSLQNDKTRSSVLNYLNSIYPSFY